MTARGISTAWRVTAGFAIAASCAIAVGCAVGAATRSSGAGAPTLLDDEHAAERAMLMAAINAARVEAGSGTVAVDTLATLVAQTHARAMVAGGFFSHYGSTGDAPYERYAAAGGRAHVRENVFQSRVSGGSRDDSATSRRAFSMAKVHELLMESPGHRETILDPNRTHVGIGVAVDDEETKLVVVEDFTARHAEIELPSLAWRRSSNVLRGRMLDRDARPLLVVLSREPAVRDWVARGDPPPAGPYTDGDGEAILVPPWQMVRRRDGTFEVELPLAQHPPGRFYGVLYGASARTVERALDRGRASTEDGWPAAAFVIDLL